MTLEGLLRIVSTPKRTIGARQRVVRRAPLGEQRDRALQVRHRRLIVACGRRDASKSEFGGGFGRRFAAQRLE